ncbi:glycosyltransferase [Dactylosporangium sp. NBC_01737]|uniref:glycosyltransferase n=1 Tax=Dactylosporangium sp. NBC_01737 TaxID=2975959 RepID=UPI002E157C4D|nr:glycosyltransferase [Dactylosporangium sp. NBC_01737]
MTSELRVMSIYEGFFSGGARALHSAVVAGLHTGGSHRHSVLSIYGAMHRETILQRMEDDASYRALTAAGVTVTSLRRRVGGTSVGGTGAGGTRAGGTRAGGTRAGGGIGGTGGGGARRTFSAAEVATAAVHAERADIVLTLKEQPLRLVNRPEFPHRPVIVCLHRSDPEHQDGALADLRAAVAGGRIAAAICCAESARTAYEAAGIPSGLLRVIPNGVDLSRFRPVPVGRRAAVRRAVGVPVKATVVTLAARYDPMKDVPLFLRAARAFLRRAPSGHVLLCGAGMSTANAELCGRLTDVFAEEPRLLSRVHLLGIRRDMEAVYAASDVVALTSVRGEAAPLCLIEGAMCGAVPVTTDVGDSADLVAGHGLVTSRDPDAIGAAWAEAARRREELGPALLRSRGRFSQTRMIASYAALIEHVHRDAGVRAR